MYTQTSKFYFLARTGVPPHPKFFFDLITGAPPPYRPDVSQNQIKMTEQEILEAKLAQMKADSSVKAIVRNAKPWEKRVPIGEDFPLQKCTTKPPIEGRLRKDGTRPELFPVHLEVADKSTVIPAGLAILLIQANSSVGSLSAEHADGTFDILSFDPAQLGRTNGEVITA